MISSSPLQQEICFEICVYFLFVTGMVIAAIRTRCGAQKAEENHSSNRREGLESPSQVARCGEAPVLFVPSREHLPVPPRLATPRHILISLDGSVLAEEILTPALELGQRKSLAYNSSGQEHPAEKRSAVERRYRVK
jgi:hypothetical protein